MIKFMRKTETAQLPKRQSKGAAAFDLHYDGDSMELYAGQQYMFETNVAVQLGDNIAGVIKARSGWALKYGIAVQAGLIDPDFTGTIKVIMINLGDRTLHINHGDRIAQLLAVPFVGESCEVEYLDETERGSGGFGSTGVESQSIT